MNNYKNSLDHIILEGYEFKTRDAKMLAIDMLNLFRSQENGTIDAHQLNVQTKFIKQRIRTYPNEHDRIQLTNFYQTYFGAVTETTVAGGGTFGSASGMGEYGGSVGNVDFYAAGNSMNLFGSGYKKKTKKGKNKPKFNLYRRTFGEVLALEDVEEKVDPTLDCIIYSEKHINLIKDILANFRAAYNIIESGVLEVRGNDNDLRTLVESIQSITTEEPFNNGEIVMMIGEFDTSLLKKPKRDFTEYDQKQLNVGTQVELEHTTSAEIAKIIAANHLDEDEEYYIKLRKAKL